MYLIKTIILKRYFINPFLRHPLRTLLLIIIFSFLNNWSTFLDTTKTFDLVMLVAIVIILLIVFIPIIDEISFYSQFNLSKQRLSFIKNHIEYNPKKYNELSDDLSSLRIKNFILNLPIQNNTLIENFNISYDFLRQLLKKSVGKYDSHFSTNDDEKKSVFKEIDCFFDSTMKMVAHDPFNIYILDDFFRNFEEFMFGNIKSPNITQIHDFFDELNCTLFGLDEDLFNRTKENLEKYYDKDSKSFLINLKDEIYSKPIGTSILIIAVILQYYSDIITNIVKLLDTFF